MSQTVAWRDDQPITDTDLAYQILTTGGEDLRETVFHYLLKQELVRIAHGEGVVADPAAVEARLASLEQVEGFAATLELMAIDADRFAQELADEELILTWMENEEGVGEQAVAALYEREFKGKMTASAVRMRHILLEASPEEREAARDKMRLVAAEGSPFEAKAQMYSACPSASAGGDLGWLQPDMVVAGFAPLFDREPGSEATVVETEFGVHLVEVTARQEAAPIPEEEGFALARKNLATLARKERLANLMRQLRQEVRFADETS